MELPIHIVNAFAFGAFTGNPAAVVVTERPLAEKLMQQIAAQNNLAETAFVVTGENPMSIRWFTPSVEVDLCGHATLASAQVLFSDVYRDKTELTFSSRSGELRVSRLEEQLQLDFPLRRPDTEPAPSFSTLAAVLGCEPTLIDDCFHATALVVVLKDEHNVPQLQPEMKKIRDLHPFAVALTAPGDSVDFVVRFFAPNAGIDEDPVTGSAYTFLAPYWSERLHKKELSARQLSKRGGELECRVTGNRVLIAGRAMNYLRGNIVV